LVYVVDAADRKRFEEAQGELLRLLEDEKLSNVPTLLFANKVDLLQAAPIEDITEAMALANITSRNWTIQACSAKTGEGLQEGMEWIIKAIQSS
jgi:ADP-ribosylation factor-like protein 3